MPDKDSNGNGGKQIAILKATDSAIYAQLDYLKETVDDTHKILQKFLEPNGVFDETCDSVTRHDEKIDQLCSDTVEIKNTLKTFINNTTDVRLHCSNEFGMISTNIKIIWGFLTTVFSGLVAVAVKLIFFQGK